MLNLEKFAEGVASIARAFGIQSDQGKLLLTAEGFLTVILVTVVSIFSVEHIVEVIVADFFKTNAPHPYQWDAFKYGIAIVVLSIILVLIRELTLRNRDS